MTGTHETRVAVGRARGVGGMTATMTVTGGRLDFGARDCLRCGRLPGREITFPLVPCAKCHGTGRRGTGTCRACDYYADRYGRGNVPDHTRALDAGAPCRECGGCATVPGTRTDYVPRDIVAAIPLTVTGHGAQLSTLESCMGVWGAVATVVDYGRMTAVMASGGADAVLTAIRASDVDYAGHVQACKVTRDDGTLARELTVTVTANGYVIRAAFDGESA